MSNPLVAASLLSDDPLVTLSTRRPATGQALGLMSVRPDLAEGGPSFHLLTLAWSHESDWHAGRLRDDLASFARLAPQARFLILANTLQEQKIFTRFGLDCVFGPTLCLVDTARYSCSPPVDAAAGTDAVYVAGLAPYKRHSLAREIRSLSLLYWPPEPAEVIATRQALPQAIFSNHELNDGVYRLLEGADYCAALGRAKVGLCLSAEEGPMRASVEYMLCGLPVVSTEARGGRIDMLEGPYLSVVAAEPAALADAVARWVANPPDPQVVRSALLDRITALRSRLMAQVHDWLLAQGGPALAPDDFARMITPGIWKARPADKVVAKTG